jgi:hypothetical protein
MDIIASAFGRPRWAEKWPTLTLQTSALPLGYGAGRPQNLAQLDPGVIAAVDDVDDLVAHRQVEPDMRMGSKESIQARIVAGPSPQSSCRSRYGLGWSWCPYLLSLRKSSSASTRSARETLVASVEHPSRAPGRATGDPEAARRAALR